jgi:short-subunit dehydrogenase
MSTKESKGSALITGASTGIGALYADRLARRGYDLVLVARNRERLDAIARQITDQTRRSVEVIAADLNDTAGLARIESKLRNDASVTLLVNNAGVGGAGPLLSSDVNKMDDMISLNVRALTRLTYAVVPGLVARGHGAIINIASIVALAPDLLNGVYGATKAFVLAFSQSLQHELADKGIRVQVVLPGVIATPFWDTAGMPVQNLPAQMVMSAEDLVDAALAGFDLGEFATLPSLPDAAQWGNFDAARVALRPGLSLKSPAQRYGISRRAAA